MSDTDAATDTRRVIDDPDLLAYCDRLDALSRRIIAAHPHLFTPPKTPEPVGRDAGATKKASTGWPEP